MQIKTGAFSPESRIPEKYTCQGADISPALSWEGVPEKTRSFSLIMDDPDAPGKTWVHWVIYNIPAETRSLPERFSPAERLKNGLLQGRNDFGEIGYGGPCPPPGHGPHRYFFKLYALDTDLNLKPGAGKKDVEKAMDGHILGQAELIGRFERRL